MSFILEALKKSARERERGNIPTIEANHKTEYDLHFSRHRAGSTTKWFILLPLVLLPAIVFAAWYGLQQNSSKGNATNSPPAQTAVIEQTQSRSDNTTAVSMKLENRVKVDMAKQNPIVVDSSDLNTPKTVLKVITREASSQQPTPQTPSEKITLSSQDEAGLKIITPTVQESGEKEPPLLSYLPLELRNKIPEIKVAGHAYSEIPAKRMIMINNKIVRERSVIAPKLYLEEITVNGIILNYDSTRFRIDLYE